MVVLMRSQQCVATSRNSGVRCKKLAIRGATVCRNHGGATPQVKRKAQERVTLAEALALGDRRPPFEVISDALHAADVIMRDVRARVENDEGASAELLTRFVESLERAARLAKLTIDGKFIEMRMWVQRAEGEEIASVFNEALALAQLPDEYDTAMRRALGTVLRRTEPAGSTAPAALTNSPASPAGRPLVVDATVVSDGSAEDSP